MSQNVVSNKITTADEKAELIAVLEKAQNAWSVDYESDEAFEHESGVTDQDFNFLTDRVEHEDFWSDWNYARLIAQAKALTI